MVLLETRYITVKSNGPLQRHVHSRIRKDLSLLVASYICCVRDGRALLLGLDNHLLQDVMVSRDPVIVLIAAHSGK